LKDGKVICKKRVADEATFLIVMRKYLSENTQISKNTLTFTFDTDTLKVHIVLQKSNGAFEL